ncbi:hypothetical protein IWQ60_011481 [Tieghemiomyces parasiticus]|uniref:Lytic polysaccharide monooxygenase n=1 Tax=Tieghemiomyces parasiticus TaxID=78921 RepID=A0A9W8DLL8_9FUNG|nr:hypothetical protein IWQ60_011481 [Tieghemiomyces parasiticus]
MYAPAKVTLLSLAVLGMANVVRSHVSVAFPCVPNSDYSKCKGFGEQDDNLAAPTGEAMSYEDHAGIENMGGGVCRNSIPKKNAGAWTAGTTETVLMSNHGVHKFGNCQWSVSYNGGKTFAVFDQTFKDCLSESEATTNENGKELFNIKVKVPANLPAKKDAIVSWTWNSRSDYRELFWNCMMLDIVNPSSPASFTAPPLSLFNFVFTVSGKKYGYVLPDMAGDANDWSDLYINQPKITVTPGGKVTGGDGGIFPVFIEAKKGDTISASQAVYISEKTLPKPLPSQGTGTSDGGTDIEAPEDPEASGTTEDPEATETTDDNLDEESATANESESSPSNSDEDPDEENTDEPESEDSTSSNKDESKEEDDADSEDKTRESHNQSKCGASE